MRDLLFVRIFQEDTVLGLSSRLSSVVKFMAVWIINRVARGSQHQTMQLAWATGVHKQKEDVFVPNNSHFIIWAGSPIAVLPLHGCVQVRYCRSLQRCWPRFGTALARLRTKHAGRVRRIANLFIKQNVRDAKRGAFKANPKNAMWQKTANLAPVLDFFSS